MAAQDSESAWWTLAESAAPATIAAVFRGALTAQRSRITTFAIDVLSDDPWPQDVGWAVDTLQTRFAVQSAQWRRRWRWRSPGDTVALHLADVNDFTLALALAPFTIGGTGQTAAGRIIWSGNDTGTSGAFNLTPIEVDQTRRFATDHGGDPLELVPLDQHKPSPQ